MRRLTAGAVLLILAIALAPPVGARTSASSTAAVDDCLDRPAIVALSGPQRSYPARSSLPDGAGVDARGAIWEADDLYPVLIRGYEGEERRDLCFVGGRIINPMPHDTTDWDEWHGTAGIVVRRGNFELLGTELDNVGDGVRFSGPQAQNWTIQDVRMRRVHDDCVENDSMNSGTITDSYFDGCYVFYSARGPRNAGVDGHDQTVTITDSLVRLEPMPSLYDDSPGPGHGPIFKLSTTPSSGRSPRLVVRDTVFRVDQPAHHGNLGVSSLNDDSDLDTPSIPYLDPADCSNNTVVWLGEGPYPADLPPCFEVTTDPRVWDRAVADWETPPQTARTARTAADRLVETLVRATCGRIRAAGED